MSDPSDDAAHATADTADTADDDRLERSVVAAAERLLDETGAAFTMARLEAEAGVSRATIYRRVGGKAELLARLAEARGESFEPLDARADILEATRTVLGRAGFAAATIEGIAAEAGVGVATVYRHFGDKETLLRAFAEEATPRAAVRELALHPGDDVAADLETIVRATLGFFFDNRDVLRLVLLGGERERSYLERLRGRSDSTLARLTDYFGAQLEAGRLRDAGAPADLALALMGMILSFAVIGPLHYGTRLDEPQRNARLIVELFLNGLREDPRERAS